jgi:cold shock CspA family protein
MPKGLITYWNSKRAFGFANNYDGGPPIFLHISSFADFVMSEGIRPGLRIEFEIEPQPDHKTKAANARILDMLDSREPGEVKTKRLERN